MNRLILIGNGFDLAHGLKTSYADFIDWYWEEWGYILQGAHKRIVEDRFCSFKLRDNIEYDWYGVFHILYRANNPMKPWTGLDAVEFAKQEELCFFSIKNPFFKKICNEVSAKNWVDIEDVYYYFLKSCSNPKRINDDLEFVKDKLVEYLSSLQNATINPVIKEQILEPISRFDTAISSKKHWKNHMPEQAPDSIMLLNFNYTNTADVYFPKENHISVNHIHGTISNPESIIFGYGDELDDEYEVLMRKNDNEFLRHIKSFRYLDTSNYKRMLGFIESAPYQLCIMGHSCGISDRTLLSTLFKHDNCVSIKPYYHLKEDGTDNYRELVFNIARNFSDPRLMRDRVVRKERCEPLGKVRKE